MALPKPAGHISWVPGEDVSKAVEPSSGKKAAGYVVNERPPAEEHNWLFARLGNWQLYFESITDELAAQLINYDAIVGAASGATHADLAAAIADAGPGWRILVLDDETVNTRVGVNISDIEIDCKPGVTFTKGSDTVGIEFSGARVKWRNARFVGFTTGGDIAMRFLSGADYCQVTGTIFAVSTASEVDDSAVTAGKTPYTQTITEV